MIPAALQFTKKRIDHAACRVNIHECVCVYFVLSYVALLVYSEHVTPCSIPT